MSSILLEVVKFVHLLIDIAVSTYIFIFKSVYDIYYASFILLQTIHWALLKNECIFTYIEKRIIDPTYELGSNIKYQPHAETYHNKITVTLKAILVLSTLLIIIYRSKNILVKIIAGLAILFWVYLTYFY